MHPFSWVGHWPFGYWLVMALKPKTIVELGAHSGNSLFCFAQACVEHQVQACIHAVDTWQGDPHAGSYDGEVFSSVQDHTREYYRGIVTLHQKTFDQAALEINRGAVDLLHIDGLHSYDAVKHDFQTWRSRCNDNAIILFHDTAVHRDDFGVHRFWEELISTHRHFEFLHSNGLGVLALGSTLPPLMVEFFEAARDPGTAERIREFFAAAGSVTLRHAEFAHTLAGYTTSYHAERHLRFLAEQKMRELQSSNSWRVTAPLRWLRALLTKR